MSNLHNAIPEINENELELLSNSLEIQSRYEQDFVPANNQNENSWCTQIFDDSLDGFYPDMDD